MRKLVHVILSPACRLVRLALGEKRVPFELVVADEATAHLPVLIEEDGTKATGLWALVDHMENEYPEHPLVPEDAAERGEAFRLLDWIMTGFYEETTRRIVFEKASQSHTGSRIRQPPNMQTMRQGRESLRAALLELGMLADTRGFLASRDVTLADLALAAHLSALDYYGEIPWADFAGISEWYARLKSRPSFRPLLTDKVPGQPPVPHYAELDF